MKVQRGDVVLVDYPFSDRTGSKVRPCLVVQADYNNTRLDDTIVIRWVLLAVLAPGRWLDHLAGR